MIETKYNLKKTVRIQKEKMKTKQNTLKYTIKEEDLDSEWENASLTDIHFPRK